MNCTLIVLGFGIRSTDTISLENTSVRIIKYNEFDRVQGLKFKSISFVGVIPYRSEIIEQFLPYLR